MFGWPLGGDPTAGDQLISRLVLMKQMQKQPRTWAVAQKTHSAPLRVTGRRQIANAARVISLCHVYSICAAPCLCSWCNFICQSLAELNPGQFHQPIHHKRG